MPDPLTTLRRFTPDGGLDRDVLMYQAGRASAPSPSRWKALAALLAVGQALTLLVLAWPTPRPAAPAVPTVAPPERTWEAQVEAPRQKLLNEAGELRPVRGDSDVAPDEPPLRVHTSWTTLSID
jgi:hypothetical protein